MTASREATPSTAALLQYQQFQDAGSDNDTHHATADMSTNTNAHNNSNANIAPQHLFDSSTVSSADASAPTHYPLPPTDDSQHSAPDLQSENSDLRTRVSELEVINDLFRGRVTELEGEVVELRRMLDERFDARNGKRKVDDGMDDMNVGDGSTSKKVRVNGAMEDELWGGGGDGA